MLHIALEKCIKQIGAPFTMFAKHFITGVQAAQSKYCKFGNLLCDINLQIFCFQFISEFLISRASVHIYYKAYSVTLLARTLNLRGNQFANISENEVLANISESTVFYLYNIPRLFKKTPYYFVSY